MSLQKQNVWPIMATQGRQKGKGCPKPTGVMISNTTICFGLHQWGDKKILRTETVALSPSFSYSENDLYLER